MVRDDRLRAREPVAGEPGQHAALVRDLGRQDDVEHRDAVARGQEQAGALVGDERFAELERISIELYTTAAEALLEKGIVIADTKFELGLADDGTVVLGDEIFTPDSSRFWPADEYQPGGPQPSFDKQFVRDYTESLGWDKTPPGPGLPDDVVAGTRARYVEAFEQITRMSFDEYAAEPTTVLV